MSIVISIIVPIYNAEKYLSECLESIIKQTYQNIEIILVDDGSTDDSIKIAEKYQERDSRIKLIKNMHRGLVYTRKIGVENARGEYIGFVDSDDWVEGNLIECAVQCLRDRQFDIVSYSMKSVNNGRLTKWKNTVPNGKYDKSNLQNLYKKMMFDFEKGCPGIIQSLDTKLFRSTILKKAFYDIESKITYGEDAAITYVAFLLAREVYIMDVALYNYRVHNNSMCHLPDINKFTEIQLFQKYMQMQFAKYDEQYGLQRQLQAYIIHFLEMAIRNNYGIEYKYKYRIPRKLLHNVERIILYGAGVVGRSFYRQIKQLPCYEIVAWADSVHYGEKIEGCEIVSPKDLHNRVYDVILISVLTEEIAVSIKEGLLEIGIPEGKIRWEEPVINWWEKEIVIDSSTN